MVKKVLLSLTMVLFIFMDVSYSAHPLITDDAGTQGRGKAQIEINTGFAFERVDAKGVSVKERAGEAATALSYGIAERVDLVVGIPYIWGSIKEDGVTVYKESGLSDISLEAKWRFYETEDGLSFAVKPGISLPTGDDEKGLGAGRTAYGITLITTQELDPWAFHLNLGYTYGDNKADEVKDIWHISASAEVEVIKDLKTVGNIGIERSPDKTSDTNPAFILGGLIYSVTETVDIDLGVKAGLNKPEADMTLLAGAAFRF